MTYNAIVEDTGPSGYTASILGWPSCTAKGTTKDEALARLRQAIALAKECVLVTRNARDFSHPRRRGSADAPRKGGK